MIEKLNPLDISKDIEIIEALYTTESNLGAIYHKKKTIFRVWSPTASSINLLLYKVGNINRVSMKRSLEGVWSTDIKGNMHLQEYAFEITYKDEIKIATDPYCKAINAAGDRSIVIDHKRTNPKGWNDLKVKKETCLEIIYEMSIKDITSSVSLDIKERYKGKFLGLTSRHEEENAILNYIENLGITHLQLMPIYDFTSGIDLDDEYYNWGYNPKNFNVPEGIYSTEYSNPVTRIFELKKMISSLKQHGKKIIMDVVYNHHTDALNSNFNKLVPDYYFRKNEFNEFSNGSGCGNEFATERKMVRKFIVDSMIYWAKEFKIDGFRLDLMGLYDIETIKEIRRKLDELDSNILIYGEGWTGGNSSLGKEQAMIKENLRGLGNIKISCFNDLFRDSVRGNVFNIEEKGFVSGGYGQEERLKLAIVGGIKHKNINFEKVGQGYMFNEPYQSINYVSCHDDHTLYDKLVLANNEEDESVILDMTYLVATILLTSQGRVFIHCGEEFMRTKEDENGNKISNSYMAGTKVNEIDWKRVNKYKELSLFYKNLIKIRKKHKVFNILNSKLINDAIVFLDDNKFNEQGNIVAYTIDGVLLGDTWKKVLIIFNGSKQMKTVSVEKGGWNVILNKNKIDENGIDYIEGEKIEIEANSAIIAIME
ncbi:MAG: type I pullulanase [Sarcina sp.]